VQICCTAITFGGIKTSISAVIKLLSALRAVAVAHVSVDIVRIDIAGPVGVVAYFTSVGYFAVVVNFRLPSVKHLDYVAGPTVHTGTTPRANLAFKAPMLVSQGISLLLVHHCPHSMPMMW